METGTRLDHGLAEARSLALHREVARRIQNDPQLLAEVRARVARWLEDGSVDARYAKRWHDVLAADVDAIAAAITVDDASTRALRQTTPFAGVVDPQTRWQIWAAVKEAYNR